MGSTEFDLLTLAEGVSLRLADDARKKQIALVVFMEPELPKLFVEDGELIAALLQSLTSAAIESCKPGCDIGIGISAGDPVHDSTVGVAAIRFGITYTDIGSKPDTSFAETISAKMGIDVHFRQEVLRGSEFYFVLQLRVAPAISTNPLYALHVTNAKRTLVISNEPPPNRSLHLNMRYWGLRCDGAPTMQEGMLELTREAALGKPYDLVVVAEPIEDGSPLQIAELIKNSDLKNARLIHVDRFYDAESERRSFEVGFDAYIAKPFVQKDFLQLVAAQLGMDTEATNKPAPHVVLVVDDNLTNQKLAVFQLRRLELDAAVASNGQDALDAMVDRDFGLILLDYDMPVLNGLETLKRIRSNAKYKDLPVVILTGNSEDSLKQEFLAAGASEFLIRPVSCEQLKRVVETWMDRGKQRSCAKTKLATD